MKKHSTELVNGQSRRVVMDADNEQTHALILLKILSQSDAEYRKGRWKSQEEVEADFEKKFRD